MPETLGSFRQRITKLPIGAAVDQDVLNGFIQDRIERITRMYDWTRLEKEGVLQTVPAYVTGTVSILAGATAGTGVGTTFTALMTGRLIRVANLIPFYTFTRVSNTSFTIDREFEGATDQTDAAFRIWQPVYELPSDLEEIFSLRNLGWGQDLEEQTREYLDRFAAGRLRYGPPRVYVPAEDSANGLAQIELYPGPEDGEGLPIRYKAGPPLFNFETETGATQFPNWFSVPAIFAGVKADLYDLQGDASSSAKEEQRFLMLVTEMMGEDARKRPPTSPMLADRFTSHRRDRITRNKARWRNWTSAN